jgi:hypothetical protein
MLIDKILDGNVVNDTVYGIQELLPYHYGFAYTVSFALNRIIIQAGNR